MPPELLKPLTKPFIGSGWPQYAGFWRRLLALLVDLVVLLPVFALHWWLKTLSRNLAIALVLPTIFVYSGYTVYFHGRWGQTLGKMVARIRVVRMDGFPVTWRDSLIRSFVDIVYSATMGVGTLITLSSITASEYDSLRLAYRSNILTYSNPVPELIRQVYELWTLSEVIVLFFNRKKRALHDYMAGTVVMHCRKAQEDREDSSNE